MTETKQENLETLDIRTWEYLKICERCWLTQKKSLAHSVCPFLSIGSKVETSHHRKQNPIFRERPPGLINHVLTVLVFWSCALLLPRLPPSSRSPKLLPWASILRPLRANFWICCPQLPYRPCKNGTHSTCFTAQGVTRGHLRARFSARFLGNFFQTFWCILQQKHLCPATPELCHGSFCFGKLWRQSDSHRNPAAALQAAALQGRGAVEVRLDSLVHSSSHAKLFCQ